MSETLTDFTGEVRPKTVEVCGIRLALKEFDMRTRGLWLDVAEKYNLSDLQAELQTEIIPKLSNIGASVENDPRIKSIEQRLEKLLEKHEGLLEVYATDDEPDDIDEQLEAVVKRQEALREDLERMVAKVQAEVGEQAKYAEKRVTELMEKQDEARVYFVWELATALEKTDEDFEEFYGRAGSEDYDAAERFLNEGNAPWASLYADRMQERSKKRKAKLN